ncbi:MAG TPA: ATP-grasp peptide maturase system methyltransferase [Amycolatopsis sp.]|uniref:ATP-grasp peptide maturase system methyltransferase n=1 Tax=Amycolatopsis sp. TaxID=37632 RepID=UPI002B4916AD|nr:ATP-grasp peptide maturase system methyltransferase [Amycolatopsis sp.]HKS48413.1 ATP-grasp peptide maturase system methyltransferase [Amycolatopsis sp.]
MQSPGRQRRRLVEAMLRDGALADPAWISAFRQVPRHAFVPRFFAPTDRHWTAVHRGDTDWLARVYSDNVLVTQLDDDPSRWATARRDGPVPGTPTCSSSMPTIMAIMLEELLVGNGNHVLEIGTGTGYNAALLCHRLGSACVSTVDIDADLVRAAKIRLATCGYHPACAVGDGVKGFPDNAPYQRVLSTCAVSAIPAAWLEQTAPGGFIVTTLNRPIGAGLVRIEVGAGAVGQGRVLARDGRFMPLRAHRVADPDGLVTAIHRDHGSPRRTHLPIREVLDPSHPFEFFAGLALPEVSAALDPAQPSVAFLVHADGSWTRHQSRDGEHLVTQGGPRRLWDLVETAYQEWLALGAPSRDRFGITVSPDRQVLWLDSPGSPHRWPLASART